MCEKIVWKTGENPMKRLTGGETGIGGPKSYHVKNGVIGKENQE